MPIADLDDIQLNYKSRGEGFPVLGVMGFALDQRAWAPTIPAVTKNNRFITFDNRGIGYSTGGPAASIDQMADDAVRLLDHLEIDKAVVFGVSMGGTIAQRIVLDHPDRVSGLILGITFARPIEFMRRQHDLSRRLVEGAGIEGLMQGSLLRMFTPEFFEMGRELVDQIARAFVAEEDKMPTPEVLVAQVNALDKHDVLEDLKTVKVPTLVFGARMDVMVPYLGSKEIAATIPGAKLVTFETGHGCMVEEMDAVNKTVEDFLAQF